MDSPNPSTPPPVPVSSASECGGSCLPSFFSAVIGRTRNDLAQRAIGLLRQTPDAFVSVGEWASAVGVSREHLSRAVSPTISPHALLQAARVNVALDQLNGQATLRAGEALDAMGYNSRAHASAVFRKTTGLSPTQYWHRRRTPKNGECTLDRCPLLGAVMRLAGDRG